MAAVLAPGPAAPRSSEYQRRTIGVVIFGAEAESSTAKGHEPNPVPARGEAVDATPGTSLARHGLLPP